MRFFYLFAGLVLAVNAIFVGLRLYETQSRFTLWAVAPALLAALALGMLLIVKNVRSAPPEDDDQQHTEPPESE